MKRRMEVHAPAAVRPFLSECQYLRQGSRLCSKWRPNLWSQKEPAQVTTERWSPARKSVLQSPGGGASLLAEALGRLSRELCSRPCPVRVERTLLTTTRNQ
eukprot:6007425-Lingulodinium_polyedra.AAC.1